MDPSYVAASTHIDPHKLDRTLIRTREAQKAPEDDIHAVWSLLPLAQRVHRQPHPSHWYVHFKVPPFLPIFSDFNSLLRAPMPQTNLSFPISTLQRSSVCLMRNLSTSPLQDSSLSVAWSWRLALSALQWLVLLHKPSEKIPSSTSS